MSIQLAHGTLAIYEEAGRRFRVEREVYEYVEGEGLVPVYQSQLDMRLSDHRYIEEQTSRPIQYGRPAKQQRFIDNDTFKISDATRVEIQEQIDLCQNTFGE